MGWFGLGNPPPQALARTQSTAKAAELDWPDHNLHAAVQIGNILRALQSERHPLAILCAGEEVPYLTMVLDVDEERREFLLDPVRPEEAHRKLTGVSHFNAVGRCGSITVSFSAEIAEFVAQGAVSYYRVPFPEDVLYLQLRDHFRIRPAHREEAELRIDPANSATGSLKVEVTDLSEGGVGFVVEAENGLPIGKSDVLEHCTLTFPKHALPDLQLEVRHVDTSTGHSGKVHVGAKFVDMPDIVRRVIRLYVLGREAELSRR